MNHDLKSDLDPFGLVWAGQKTFELRTNDRGYQMGDTLTLQECDGGAFTGRVCVVRATHVMTEGYGLPAGLCIIGFNPAARLQFVRPVTVVPTPLPPLPFPHTEEPDDPSFWFPTPPAAEVDDFMADVAAAMRERGREDSAVRPPCGGHGA